VGPSPKLPIILISGPLLSLSFFIFLLFFSGPVLSLFLHLSPFLLRPCPLSLSSSFSFSSQALSSLSFFIFLIFFSGPVLSLFLHLSHFLLRPCPLSLSSSFSFSLHSSSVVDPDSTGSLDPDLGGKNYPEK
jgi:hypothetical protein